MDGAAPSGDPAEAVHIPDDFFKGQTYHIASSFPPARAEELDAALSAHGATRAEGVNDLSLNLVIADSPVWEGWEIVEQREREAREKDGVMEGAEPRARLVEVVTDKWVDRSLLTGKLQLPQHYSTNPSHLFSGVVACGTGLPTTDLEVISGGITGLGGQWRTGLTKEVTHLFAISPGTSKFSTALHYQADTGIKVLLPHWFDDAVRLGIRDLDTAPYEWPEPIMLKQKNEPQLANPALANDDDDMGDISPEKQRAKEREEMKRNMYATAALFAPAMNTSSPPSAADISLVSKHILNLSSPLRPNTNANTGTTGTTGTGADTGVPQVWAGRRVLLSRTLQLYQGRREAVQKGIERAGGVVVRFADDDEEEEEPTIVEVVVRDDAEGAPDGATRTANLIRLSAKEEERVKAEMAAVEECDVLVTRWRYGRPYIRAVRTQKTIGTLAWLFHVQSTGVLTRPLDQLLHYPVPKRIIEGFSNHKITVTNYTGEAREYLKKLIAVMGAEFTPSMSIQNTVLIAAHTSGTKANKAHSWSIPVVNHTWLEDCFVQWRNLTPALERYIVFPPGVDFSSLLGGRGLWVGSGECVTVTGSAASNGVGEKEKEAEKEKEKKKVQTKIEIEAEDVSSLMDQEEALVVAYEQQQLQQAAANPPPEDDTMQPPDASAREVQALMGDVDPDVDMDAGAGGMDFEPDPHAGEWEIPAYLTGEANEEVEEEDEQMTPKAKAKAKEPTKSPAKTTTKHKSKPKPAGSVIELHDSSDEEEPPSTKKPKAKATAASKKVAEKPVSSSKTKTPPKTPAKKSPVKTKAPARAVSEVTSVEDDPEDEEEVEEQIEEEQDQDEEDENMDADETEDFPSRVLPRSKASNGKGKETPKEKAKPTPSKSAGNAKRRVLMSSTPEEVEDDGSDEEKEEDQVMDVEEEEEVEVVEPKSTSKSKAKATEKKKAKQDESPESTPPKKHVDAKTTKSKRAVSSSSSSEDEQPKPTPKSKVQPTLTPLTPMPSSSVAKATPNGSTPANTSARAGGLLNRPKVDARTRVKKKVAGKEKIVVESEDEEEEEEVKGKGKKVATSAAAKGKKAAPVKKGKNKKAASSSEEEEEEPQWEEDEEDEEEMRPKRSNKSKSAAKPTPSSNTPAKSTPKPKSQKQTTSTRSKPLRVYSEPPSEVESEDEDPAQIDEDDEDEDESLPPAPHLLSKSEARRAASAKEKESEKAKEKQKQKPTATASVGRPKPGPASKTKGYMSTPAGKATATSKSKAKAKHAESETEEDRDSVEEVIASKPKGKQTPAAASSKGKSTAPAVSTPKRVMSVLLPSLTLSAVKPSVDVLKKGKKKVEVDRSDEEDVVVTSTRGRGRPTALTAKPKLTAKHPPSKSATTAKAAPKSKAISKRAASPEEEEESGTDDKTRESEQEEEEVSVLVSPRTRAVARTESLRVVADLTAVASPSAAARTRGTSSAKPAGKSKVNNSKSTTAMDVDQPVAESSSHPKRNAATKATQRLRDTLMPDLISFEAQMRKARRTSGRGGLDAFVVEGVDDDGYGNKSGSRKRGSTQDDDDEDEGSKKKKRRVSGVADEEGEVVVVVKKDVKGKGKGKEKEKEDPMDVDEEVPSTGIMVMTTQVTLGDDTIKALAKLGVKMTTRPGECTHLLARQVVRTEKFLCALASSPYILSEKWALTSAEAKRLLPEKDFILKDKAGETKYGIDLVKSLRRAKENKGKLLDGHIFYVTPKVPVDTKLLKSVVNACGGQVTTQTPSVRIINAAPETRHVISCKDDISIWRPIASLGIKIYTQEFLLNGALNQKMEWDRDDLTVQV
ncbi:hypothetical protein BDN70DRAFT_856332 [Pholiota conissans]|uniref:BRCT domain-containing protein n=1 Tax=Pholiota conissans TaxID=109636 RepID=A0A9P5Z3I3_9AGAR|nr:hypothetical protein BDN70DRAFT_856332 [Pholiota conissans]